jgi:hypothetical protein
LNHLLVDAVSHELRELSAAVIVSDVVLLAEGVGEVGLRLSDGEIVELELTSLHDDVDVAGRCLAALTTFGGSERGFQVLD